MSTNDPMAGADDLTAGPDAVRPLGARSLALSALLGTHPPRLPVAGLIALGELFDIAPSAMRTALSRMVRDGEATADEGRYRLSGALLRRQGEQDLGLERPAESDDGAWWSVQVTAGRRPLAERRDFRRRMEGARLGELRPDSWLRPANTPAPDVRADEGLLVRGELAVGDPAELAAQLWDLDDLDARARRLSARLEAAVEPERPGPLRDDAIPTAFTASAAAVRFLRSEPWLPPSLHDPAAADELRARYRVAQDRLQNALKEFFASAEER